MALFLVYRSGMMDHASSWAAQEHFEREARHRCWLRRRLMVLLRHRALGKGGSLEPLHLDVDGQALALRLFGLVDPLWRLALGYL